MPGSWRHICPFSACVTDGQRGPQISSSKLGMTGLSQGGTQCALRVAQEKTRRVIVRSSASLCNICTHKAALSMMKHAGVSGS